MKLLAAILSIVLVSSVPSIVYAQSQPRYEYRYDRRDDTAFVKGVVGGLIIGSIISNEDRYNKEYRYRYDRDYRYERRYSRDVYQERCWLTPYYDNHGRKVFVQECYPNR